MTGSQGSISKKGNSKGTLPRPDNKAFGANQAGKKVDGNARYANFVLVGRNWLNTDVRFALAYQDGVRHRSKLHTAEAWVGSLER